MVGVGVGEGNGGRGMRRGSWVDDSMDVQEEGQERVSSH